MLEQEVLKIIQQYDLVETGDKIIIGVSGGPDSVCLLHILGKLSSDLNISLFAVHINHMLRGEESNEDERYVTELCSRLSIPLTVKKIDIKKISQEKGISLEEAGREIRYLEFELEAQRHSAEKIAVAHNKNDQAETVLMHIIRGSGLDGLKGMDIKRKKLIRPLLFTERKDIEEYCVQNSLNPRVDSSNLESVYTRNKVRLELIPAIDSIFKTDISKSISKMAVLIKDDSDFIEEQVDSLYRKCITKSEASEIWLNLKILKTIHPAERKRILRNALKSVNFDLKGIEAVHIDSIVNLVLDGKTGSELHLPSDIRVKKSYQELCIFIKQEFKKPYNYDIVLIIPGTTSIDGPGIRVVASLVEKSDNIGKFIIIKDNSLIQYFDFDSLKKGITIRNRKEGDIFKPNKSNGKKKIKEYFIDNKIPRDKRDEIPLIANNNEIVWVVGYKISDKFKVTENTKTILKLEFIYEK